MPAKNEIKQKTIVIFFAFIFTCLAHTAMIFAATWILREQVKAIEWSVTWPQASMLGVIVVAWRMWLRPQG